jgi:integrase
MPSLKLTAVVVASLPPGNHFDSLCPGLILRVGKRRRTFAYRWRSGGRNPCITLGHFPSMSLAQAREAAREASGRIDAGIAPVPAMPHPRSAATLTLGTLIDKYEAMRRREGKRIKTLRKVMLAVRKELAPYASLPAAAFARADVRAIRDGMVARGASIQWNRVKSGLSFALNWATEEELIEYNPVLAVRRTPERDRSRVLSAAEIRIVWKACKRLGEGRGVSEPFSRLVRLLLLTGLRRGEAASIRYRDIIGGRLTVSETKTGKPHSLRLPPLALRLIGHGDDLNALAFGGSTGRPIRGWSKSIERLRKACPEIVDGWHLHDLRRTCATHLQDLAVRPDVVEAILNHSIPGVSAAASVYMRSELEELKADALQRWADEVQRIVGEPAVVAMRAVQ